jgi:hypothetical protein
MAAMSDDLARQLGAELTARGLWMPGMVSVCRDDRWRLPDSFHPHSFCAECRPDLADPATAGCLLSLLPEDCDVWRTPKSDGWMIGPHGCRGVHRWAEDGSHVFGEAIARALLAIWRDDG